jgi:hypothetical protein
MQLLKSVRLAVFCLLLIGIPAAALAQQSPSVIPDGIRVVLDDAGIEFADPVFIRSGRVFIPIRNFADAFGGEVAWDNEAREAVITTKLGDLLVFGIGNPVMTFNDRTYRMDAAPFLENQRTYVPLRHAAEFMHMQVEWDPETQTVTLRDIPLHVTAEADTIGKVAELYGIAPELLIELNGLTQDETLAPETALRIVVPLIMAEKIGIPAEDAAQAAEPEAHAEAAAAAQDELLLLAKIVQTEAGYESYDAQLAVANVVLNRVKDDSFPDTIHDVIYASGQFTPALDGSLETIVPGEDALRAAEEAMAGKNNVEGALYFYNPKVTSGPFWESLTLIAEIGNHRYMGR